MDRYKTILRSLGLQVGRLWQACTHSWGSVTLSCAWLVMVFVLIWPLFSWAFITSVWSTDVTQCHSGGACWSYLNENGFYLFYGLYPPSEVWRVNLLLFCMVFWLILILASVSVFMHLLLWVLFILFLPLAYALAHGAWFGLPVVSFHDWGGLSFNCLFSWMSITCALPLGCFLAILRTYPFGLYRGIARLLIDCVRGMPLICLLFFASLVMPLFMKTPVHLGQIQRLFLIFTLFGACYVAEAVRGGLQSVTKGQYEAAEVLGLSSIQTFIWVVFPQALEVAMPSLVNLVIALFKDSTLLSTVAIMDIVGMMQATTARVEWMPYVVEGYLFVGAVFWFLCTLISLLAKHVERRWMILK